MNAQKAENYILRSARNNLEIISDKLDKLTEKIPSNDSSEYSEFENMFFETIKEYYKAHSYLAMLEKIFNDENYENK